MARTIHGDIHSFLVAVQDWVGRGEVWVSFRSGGATYGLGDYLEIEWYLRPSETFFFAGKVPFARVVDELYETARAVSDQIILAMPDIEMFLKREEAERENLKKDQDHGELGVSGKDG